MGIAQLHAVAGEDGADDGTVRNGIGFEAEELHGTGS
jgi:hypothetical protein